MRYTSTPFWLRLESEFVVSRYARREGIEDLTDPEKDLVYDLICRSVGVDMLPFDEAALMAQELSKARSELSRDSYYQSFPAKLEMDIRDAAEREVKPKRVLHDLVEHFQLSNMPGRNDLQQAVRVIKLMRLLKEWRSREVFHGLGLLALLIDMLTRAAELQDDMVAMFMVPGGDDASKEDVTMQTMEFMAQSMDVPELLDIARQLNDVQGLESAKPDPRPDECGDDIRYRGIQEFGELSRASQGALAMPHRLMAYQAVTGDMQVREVIDNHQRQLIYLLVDGTGSMGNNQRRPLSRAAGTVLNRLQAVIDGDAEVYLRFFDTKLGETEYHADSPESARELMKVATDPSSYSARGTNFITSLGQASERMRELVAEGRFHHPEMAIVTDGTDDIPGLSVLGGVKLHAVQVGEVLKPELAQLAISSGGVNIDATGKKLGDVTVQ